MMLKVVKILLLFALLGVACIQAVVVGPQPLHNNNRNGYRYNGPAHKYLPSEESHSHGSHVDSSHKHGQQGTSDPYNSHHYPAQQHHDQGTQEHDHHSPLAQQQHQQNHQNAYNEGPEYQQHHGLNQQQHHGFNQQQHHGLNQQYQSYGQQHYQQSPNQLQHHQSQHLAEHAYEPAHFQQQQPQEHEPWHSSQSSQSSHGFQQQQQHEQFRPQQHHNRFEQQLPLREDLWQPIRELDLEKLPSAEAHATSHQTVAAPGRDVKLVPSYTLSSDFEHDRFIGLDGTDTRLLTQSLPDAYRKQLFSSPPEPSSLSQRPHQQLKPGSAAYGGSTSDFLQMQSHSYQLPSTFSTHAEWPQDKEHQQQQDTGNRQYATSGYAVAPSYLHTSEPHTSQPPTNSLPHPSRDFQPPYY
ncbi:putative mediator of RNA polymerase II transcription subunit 26 [Drosophila santomea]|uniref:putative mediator of RNA polymerase II transcription subunit 26 n=1 Tax=Drosophila santomea TaxID=129105 RepID=UPI0019538E59|nr:putative mediator of RNA polymerase II transcription subunit 26 [Drosophila santomea]